MSVAIVGIKAELLRSKLFDTAINRLALSARAYDRTLQGAKTIGRTRRSEKISSHRFSKAIYSRTL